MFVSLLKQLNRSACPRACPTATAALVVAVAMVDALAVEAWRP